MAREVEHEAEHEKREGLIRINDLEKEIKDLKAEKAELFSKVSCLEKRYDKFKKIKAKIGDKAIQAFLEGTTRDEWLRKCTKDCLEIFEQGFQKAKEPTLEKYPNVSLDDIVVPTFDSLSGETVAPIKARDVVSQGEMSVPNGDASALCLHFVVFSLSPLSPKREYLAWWQDTTGCIVEGSLHSRFEQPFTLLRLSIPGLEPTLHPGDPDSLGGPKHFGELIYPCPLHIVQLPLQALKDATIHILSYSPTVIIGYFSSIESLSGTNFRKWKEQISIILGIMDLDYALRVDTPAALTAESSTEQKAAYEKWERSNRISLMIMKDSITTAIRGAIPDSDNAKLYLAHIEEQFQGSSKAHATTLITKMVTLKYSGSNGVREHILRMNDMASQLKGLDMEISEGNKNASVTKTDKASSSGTKGSSGPRCHFCKDKGHMRKECHKFREWLENKGNLSICVCYESYTIDAPLNTWWVDISATVHITNSLQGFLSVKKLNKGDRNVLVGNGEKAQVEAVGTLRLVLESGFNLDLVDTIYVPSMTRNLISVSRLDAYGYSFKFKNKGFFLFLYSRVIGSGLLEANLYKLLLNASLTESLKTMNVNDVVAKTCGYPERSKGFRFYCPSHTTRIVETRHAIFIEDAEYNGSSTPRIINLEEIQDHVSIHVIQKVGASLPHIEDNDAPEAAVLFSKNNRLSGGTKHIEIKYLVVRERIKNQIVSIHNISMIAMLADPMTKGLPPTVFREYVASMGLVDSLSLR
ncbi:hypothetical protein RJ639_037361 [Escallonia herrerae]|uniref:CCHC-type domain-containing protein n=1 Tax=Escallonia herrerae TaxID=1293975 RepID=A0AA89BD96_9ASTE|nr:hypothetical protein RJ639_037361 [Escallonia herrerae]